MQKLYRPSQSPVSAAWNVNSPQPLSTRQVHAIATTSIWQSLATAALICLVTSLKLHAQGSAFSYQGRLDAHGAPANGTFDFAFTLHDAPASGATFGPEVTTNGIPITNGLFSVVLDFGLNAFNGGSRWLNIAVRTNGGGSFSALSPRQQVTPSPYAIHAGSSGVASGLKGSVTVPGTITAQSFVGNGAGLTNLSSAGIRLSSLDAADGTPANALLLDDAGRVGIGTPGPFLGKLDVTGGSVVVDNGQGFFALNAARTATATGFDSGPDSSLRLSAGSQRRATLLPNGNLGLGITQPTVRLSLGNDSAVEKLALIDAPSGRTTGFGVSSDVFRLHLGAGASRFSFLTDASSVTPLVSITKDGSIESYGETGMKRVVIGPLPGRPGNGSVTVHDSAGTEKASMVVDAAGKGKLTCDYIQINGGADIAEPFEVRHDSKIQPGMVVAIDPHRPGELRLSDRAYDSTVAGIISGANGILPGLMLQQTGTPATGKHPVALSGRVWCHCDADAGGAILPGDLLTSANEPGHAMKAADRNRAPGAIIGKAMTPLPRGKGLVLVLVSLQ